MAFPIPGTSAVNQILNPSQQSASGDQSIKNAGTNSLNIQQGENSITNLNQGSINDTIGQIAGGSQNVRQSQSVDNQSGSTLDVQGASNSLENTNLGT